MSARLVGLVLVCLVAMACGEGTAPNGNQNPNPPNPPPGPGPAPQCAGTTTTVTVADNSFTPTCTRVPVGSTVTWNWAGESPHNVTFSNTALGASPTQATGSFTRRFDNAGTFDYHCTLHAGMTGAVQVQ